MQPQNSSHKSSIDPVDRLILSIEDQQPSLNQDWPTPNYDDIQLQRSFDPLINPTITPTHSHPHSTHYMHTPPTPPSQRLPPRKPISRTQRSPIRNNQHIILHHHLTPTQNPTPTTTEPFSPLQNPPHPTFALPETIAASPLSNHSASTQVYPIITNPNASIDYDKYVRESALTAESVKVEYRNQLKEEQTGREEEAKRKGSPMTAKQKERERSRRESAVTRKRAEIYIKELEKVCRRLPYMELRLRMLEFQLQRFTNHFEHANHHTTCFQVKAEPDLRTGTSPSSRTTTMTDRMQQLDLSLPNTSETGYNS